ncbi:MAG: class I SAM-dependent methyltransferase [Acidobacteriia bacterium]|nr:class I SAM-dependent methyltransferase [Terriglobia bacterium]
MEEEPSGPPRKPVGESGAPACPLCDAPGLFAETVGYFRCPSCATLTQRVPPARLALEESEARYAHGIASVERRWLGLITSADPVRRTVLDLGAGDGAFVGLARQEGWEACGLEGSPAMVARARAQEWAVDLGDVDEWAAPDKSFGVIRLWFVLEHIRYPGRLLREARRSLVPGGLLVVGIPNDANWLSQRLMRTAEDRFWEHPLHLHHFPPFGMEEWLQRLGFEIVVAEAGRPSELMRGGNLPLYETWERVREQDPTLSRLFYRLGVGRTRELIFRLSR